ncbi:tyrosine recombinase XerC [Zongyangia hominis]|uniref:Tyrosine recombinase XerC n=1 Tax=Zongyangia hominis TaxID=2763677 RepID=A0A926EC07_9FIRM|nr:tyrosine recombinase XerC [Zongyangia hominis]MBC8569584.1 tyrosine recombinase XerC [Zongyangia hominis]
MSASIYDDCPELLRSFLFYMETIKGRSPNTISGYYVDLRLFFRFLKRYRNLVPQNTPLEEINIDDVDAALLRSVTLSDVYEFMHFLSADRQNNARTRCRKSSSLKVFFHYLTTKVNVLENNPIKELEVPNSKKSLPKYLSLEESVTLLSQVEGDNKERDYCILTLFLNCGMRLSELVGINLGDIKEDSIKVTGKGNKERIIYLNDACVAALNDYLPVRLSKSPKDRQALFISRNGNRINKRRVEQIVTENLKKCGLDGMGYSAHKLRHTAATLMYQHGHVDIRALKEILGHVNIGTTEIYTHVSNEQLKKAADASPLAHVQKKSRK